MSFSQRQGLKPVKTMLQIGSIDEDLLTRLWNTILESFINKFDDRVTYGSTKSERGEMCRLIWIDFLNYPIDYIPHYQGATIIYSGGVVNKLREWFYKAQWNEIYDLVEFLSEVDIDHISSGTSHQEEFIHQCNASLKKEVAGYRIINKKIVQITTEEEIQAIEEVSSLSDKLKLVSLHLKTSLDLLADRKTPDYRNSIKESISAVESIAKLISGNSNDSLGGAIDKIKGKIKIHPSLEKGFKQIYGYTSDADGIRHGLKEMADCDFDDAKFMLVSCSAFINYLIAKSAKAGITFE